MENRGYGRVYTYRKEDGMGYGVYDPEKVFFIPDENGKVFVNDVRCRVVNKNDTSIEKVVVDGFPLANYFYTDDNGIVRSTLVDSIKLPSRYIKKDYIYNSNPSSSGNNQLLLTDYYIVKEYGKMYVSFGNANNAFGNAMVVGYSLSSGYKNFQIFNDANNPLTYIFRNWSTSNVRSTLTSWVFSDNNNITSLSDPSISYDISATSGTDPVTIQFNLLSNQADNNLYFLLFVDRNKNVTFTAIPCYDTGSGTYGVYDVIAGKFYGNSKLAGA